MFSDIRNFLNQRKRAGNAADFDRQIQRYRGDVLNPLGLNATDWELRTHKKNRRVYLSDRHVWKIYSASQRKFAKTFLQAHEVLAGESIPVPRLLHSDISNETAEEFSLVCIVMERVPGRALDLRMTESEQELFARLLGRIHSIEWSSSRQRNNLDPGRFQRKYFSSDVAGEAAEIGEWLTKTGLPPLPKLSEVVESHISEIKKLTRFHFISGDAHPNNFFLEPDRSLCMIDLDLCRFADFPVDLAYILLTVWEGDPGSRFNAPQAEPGQPEALIGQIEKCGESFLKSYFRAAQDGSYQHWLLTRRGYLLRAAIRNLWNRTKQMRPEYNAFLKRDIAHETQKAERDLRVLRALIG